MSALRPGEAETFARDGYLVRPGALTSSDVDALNARLSALIERCAREHQAGTRPSLDFWDILRASRDDASVLWDTSAPLPADARAWEARAMRAGHGLHLADDGFRAIVRHPSVGGVLAELIPPPALVVQSAVVYKQPHSDAVQFGLHQDAAYLSTEPETLVLAFLALDDMDAENGALAVVPGSHRGPRHVTLRLGARGFEPVAGTPVREDAWQTSLLSMKRGDAAFVHGRTLHASGPNRSPRPRRALIVHAVSGTSTLLDSTWVQPPAQGFERL